MSVLVKLLIVHLDLSITVLVGDVSIQTEFFNSCLLILVDGHSLVSFPLLLVSSLLSPKHTSLLIISYIDFAFSYSHRHLIPVITMRSTFAYTLLVGTILRILWLCFTSSVTAQSPDCYHYIQNITPKVLNCTSLSLKQYATLEKVMYGVKLYETSSVYTTVDPAGYSCLVSLMWDVVHYRAQLWSHCLDPVASCSWNEMMLYMGLIPRIASVYGASNVPVILSARDSAT